MPVGWCLPPRLVSSFKDALISGRIDPMKLAEMSSAERRALFEKELGRENADPINTEFERKLLLKNRQQGYVNWARKVLGENTPAGKDVISKIQRMQNVLNPADEKAFLADLAAHRMGTRVSFDEAQKIAELSKKVTETENQIGPDGKRPEYGKAVVALRNYVGDLKREASKLRLRDVYQQPGKTAAKVIETTAGTAKAIKASMDNSAIFRQGWKTLWTNPLIWQKNARQSFVDLVRQFGNKPVMDEVDADIISRPNYDLMKKAKLDIGALEEMYPTHIPEKIPVLGRAYKASEAAYTGFVRRMRADVFDKMVDVARKSDVELTPDELRSIGKMVNSLTGRGSLGRFEPAADAFNNLFFSPRFVKSQIDLLTQPLTGAGGSNFVRKQAALNLLKVAAGTAAVLATAKAVKPDSVEQDPRSSDFGKIKIGNTRFDMTGGFSSLATLAARLASMSTKSSVTGRVRPLNQTTAAGKPVYGAPTGKDVVYNFFENKLSPAAAVTVELMKGQTRQGGKPTITSELRNLFEPLPVTNAVELMNDPNSAPLLLGLIADALGISTNTYGAKPRTAPQIKP